MCDLSNQVQALKQSGIEMLHIDIIDGHFSPSLPVGLDTIRQLREKTDLIFDVHLMAAENEYFVDELLDIGVQQLVFHAESERHVDYMLNKIHSRGVRAGVALKPATSLSCLEYILDSCDCVLLMLINPGYAWNSCEKQITYAARKIGDLSLMIKARGTSTAIAVDGRISIQNILDFSAVGASHFVIGSTCLDKRDIPGGVNLLRQSVEAINGSIAV
jgi:ribulose-phosphate 3-epimerase